MSDNWVDVKDMPMEWLWVTEEATIDDVIQSGKNSIVSASNGIATIAFAVQSVDTYIVIALRCQFKDLITLLCQAATIKLGKQPGAMPNGWNCNSSALMAEYASWLRGANVGTGYVLQREDVKALLATDDFWVQRQINALLTQHGYGENVTGRNGVPLIEYAETFDIPDVTEQCGQKMVDPMELPPVPPGLEPVSRGDGESKGLWTAAAVAASAAAAVGVYYLVKKGR